MRPPPRSHAAAYVGDGLGINMLSPVIISLLPVGGAVVHSGGRIALLLLRPGRDARGPGGGVSRAVGDGARCDAPLVRRAVDAPGTAGRDRPRADRLAIRMPDRLNLAPALHAGLSALLGSPTLRILRFFFDCTNATTRRFSRFQSGESLNDTRFDVTSTPPALCKTRTTPECFIVLFAFSPRLTSTTR